MPKTAWVLPLYVHRNRRLIRDGSPERPLRLSQSSWVLLKPLQDICLCTHTQQASLDRLRRVMSPWYDLSSWRGVKNQYSVKMDEDLSADPNSWKSWHTAFTCLCAQQRSEAWHGRRPTHWSSLAHWLPQQTIPFCLMSSDARKAYEGQYVKQSCVG